MSLFFFFLSVDQSLITTCSSLRFVGKPDKFLFNGLLSLHVRNLTADKWQIHTTYVTVCRPYNHYSVRYKVLRNFIVRIVNACISLPFLPLQGLQKEKLKAILWIWRPFNWYFWSSLIYASRVFHLDGTECIRKRSSVIPISQLGERRHSALMGCSNSNSLLAHRIQPNLIT